MLDSFKKNLLQGKYKEAGEICITMDVNSIRDMIMNIAGNDNDCIAFNSL